MEQVVADASSPKMTLTPLGRGTAGHDVARGGRIRHMPLPSFEEFVLTYEPPEGVSKKDAVTVIRWIGGAAPELSTDDAGELMRRITGDATDTNAGARLTLVMIEAGYAKALIQNDQTAQSGAASDFMKPVGPSADTFDLLLTELNKAELLVNLPRAHAETQAVLLAAIRRSAETETDPERLRTLVEAYYKVPPVDEIDE